MLISELSILELSLMCKASNRYESSVWSYGYTNRVVSGIAGMERAAIIGREPKGCEVGVASTILALYCHYTSTVLALYCRANREF